MTIFFSFYIISFCLLVYSFRLDRSRKVAQKLYSAGSDVIGPIACWTCFFWTLAVFTHSLPLTHSLTLSFSDCSHSHSLLQSLCLQWTPTSFERQPKLRLTRVRPLQSLILSNVEESGGTILPPRIDIEMSEMHERARMAIYIFIMIHTLADT